MKDPDLDRRLEEVTEMHARWSQFHDFFTMALKGAKITPQAEMKFLEIKTRMAMLHDAFMESLSHDVKIGQNVMTIMTSCIMLRRIKNINNAEIQKLEFDWNEAYLLMTETIANMEEEKEKLLGVNESTYKMQLFKDRVTASIHNFFVGAVFKAMVIVSVIGFIAYGVPALDIYQWSRMRDDISFLSPVLDKIGDLVIRPMYSDYPYPDEDSIPSNDDVGADFTWVSEGLDKLTVDTLKAQLINMGFPRDQSLLDETKEIIDRNRYFGNDQQKIRSSREVMKAYYILCKDTPDAKRLIYLRTQGLDKLPPNVKKRIEEQYNFCRKANFVAVFGAEETALRVDFPQKRWLFKSKEINL